MKKSDHIKPTLLELQLCSMNLMNAPALPDLVVDGYKFEGDESADYTCKQARFVVESCGENILLSGVQGACSLDRSAHQKLVTKSFCKVSILQRGLN
jgi:hypothetical protein